MTELEQKMAVQKFVSSVLIEEISAEKREELIKGFTDALGLDWEVVSKGADFNVGKGKPMGRAVNPVWCKVFPWSC